MSEITLFERVAKIMHVGLSSELDPKTLETILPQDDEGWMRLFAMANVQKVLPMLAYGPLANPKFAALVGAEELGALANWQASFAVRMDIIKKQMAELEQFSTDKQTPTMLIKGAARFYDDLYPDISMRHMADLDLLIQDHTPFYNLINAGYDVHDHNPLLALDGTPERLAKVIADKSLHHLPPVSRLGDQVTIEFHMSPIGRSLHRLNLVDLWENARPVKPSSAFCLPSAVDQTIICIIHALYHGKGKNNLTMKLRDLYETRCLYLRLTPAEQQKVEAHFTSRGYRRDYTLIKYICFDLFGDEGLRTKPLWGHASYARRMYSNASKPKWTRLRNLRGQIIHFVTYSAFRPKMIARKLRLIAFKRRR